MNLSINNLKNVDFFLSFFDFQSAFEKKDIDRNNSKKIIYFLCLLIDALIKSENFRSNKNFDISESEGFFSKSIENLIDNTSKYLFKFDSKIFDFSKSQRQTFIFLIENLTDYLNESKILANRNNKDIFVENIFWIENFIKMFDKKILGAVELQRNIVPRNNTSVTKSFENEIFYSNSDIKISLSPFLINDGTKNMFLVNIDKNALLYRDINSNKEIAIKSPDLDLLVFKFLLANFDFYRAKLIKKRLKNNEDLLLEKSNIIENAFIRHKNGLYQESHRILEKISLEEINLPLIYLLQIKNLLKLNKILEVKRWLQKFSYLYPYYVEGYRITGEMYLKEENYEIALKSYEKAMQLTLDRRMAEKVKKIKEKTEKDKSKGGIQKSVYFYDITESVFQEGENILMREKEFRQIMEILISNSRRNLILIGDSGVGKTSLIKLLAKKIINNEVPNALKEKRIKEINFVSFLTGSKYRGQFEEKVLQLLNEFKHQDAILVLEDIHLMMSSGVSRGTSLDLVNILKKFLRENSIQVIATTNYEEFKNVVEKDNSLMGYFQKMNLNEMSVEDTGIILKNLARMSFDNENIMVSDESIRNIIENAKRSIKDKKLPDSAIMIFERCVSKIKLKAHYSNLKNLEINESDVLEVLSDVLNLPESSISVSLKDRLLNLKESLLKIIVGQDEAIDRIVANITTSKLDFDLKRNRPDGVFLFIGPTGVGKTETAIALAKTLYGSEDYLIRIDMSEYMEKFTYSRFVGAAPGYVGYYDANQLTDKVRQNPFSVILLDEFEKADPQLLNIFLQVFDAGRLTDARGNVVDFSHSTIIMTSNIGTSLFSKIQLGYQSDLNGSEVSRSTLLKTLKRYFSPEFLNRVDEIVIFRHLNDQDIKKIIHIQLSEVRENLEKQDKELIIDDKVIDYVIQKGYSKEYGARNISRVIKGAILEKIADISFEEGWEDAKHVVCSLGNNQIVVKIDQCYPNSINKTNLKEEVGKK